MSARVPPGRRLRRRWLILGAAPLLLCCALEIELRLHPYDVAALRFSESQRLLDRAGNLIREVVNAGGERARWVPLAEINPLVVQATLAAEDDRFHRHPGVDGRAALRAALQNATRGRVVSGASTLTMQLARRLRPHPRNLLGKLGEMVDALKLERALGKDEVLAQYLNRVPYGAGAMGVEAASQRYFGKPSRHLSLAEAALIAGLPNGPSRLNPLRNEAAARDRQRFVLQRMLATSRASSEDVERALRETLRFASVTPPSAIHFTDWARQRRRDPGEQRTTLDFQLQREVEDLVAGHVRALEQDGVTDAAVVVLENERCDVLAMVGSSAYWRPGTGSVNGALARRQPGSTLKPFLYGLAFERGATPATMVADVETQYGEVGGELYVPRNFSNGFSGPVLMGEALGRSLNVPAIRVAQRVGVDRFLSRLRQLGFDSLDQEASHYGLGLSLGNGEVTLLELAQAYAALARDGRTCQARAFLDEPVSPGERAYAPEVAFLVSDILSDEVLRMRAFGTNNALMPGFPVAVKTGTSTNWRDNWAVGFTARYTVGVWAGDFENRPLDQLAGASGAGPLFHRVMKRVALRDGQPRPEAPATPGGVREASVCASSGLLATPLCPERRTVKVLADHPVEPTCTHHQVLEVDARNGLLAGPKCPRRHVRREVFEVLPRQFAEWQAEHARRIPPTRYSPLCPEEGVVPRAVVITWPRPREVFVVEPGYRRETQSVELAAEVDPPVPELSWMVDGELVARARWPYTARWPLEPGRHRLQAMAPGMTSEAVEIEVR